MSAFCKDELLNCGAAFKFLRDFLLPLLEPVTLVFPLVDTVVVTCVDFPPDCNILLPDGRLFLGDRRAARRRQSGVYGFDDRVAIPVGVGILDGKLVVTADVV